MTCDTSFLRGMNDLVPRDDTALKPAMLPLPDTALFLTYQRRLNMPTLSIE